VKDLSTVFMYPHLHLYEDMHINTYE